VAVHAADPDARKETIGMSTGAQDYIVFDYLRYAREILPAVEQLARGNQLPLRSLIIDAWHRAESLYASTPLHLNRKLGDSWEPIACLFDTLARHQDLAVIDPFDGDALVNNVVSLKDSGPDDNLLKTYLLTIYCCEVPPWSQGWNWPHHGDFLLDHDEWIGEWGTYAHRDEEQTALWGAFSQPTPEPLGQHLQIDLQKLNTYDRTHFPRSISTIYLRSQITGFITIEEIQRLLEQVRTHEMPPMDRLAEFIERLGQIQPEKVEVYRQQYCQNLWMIEEEILHRMRYALSHGKGILTYYVN